MAKDHPKLAEWERRHGALTIRVPMKRWAEARDYTFRDGRVAKVLMWQDQDGERWLILEDPDEPLPAPDLSHIPPYLRPNMPLPPEHRGEADREAP
jgi:hypothetical protein